MLENGVEMCEDECNNGSAADEFEVVKRLEREMRNRHITRFGHPTAPAGALYHVSDVEGLIQMALDIDLARLYGQGYALSRSESAQLLAEIQEGQSSFENQVSASGISQDIASLLAITKKSEAKQIAKNLIITENDLFRLIHNCTQLGYAHRSRFPEFVPEHLETTEQERKGIKTGNVGKLSRKLSSLLVFRKSIHVHFFERDSEWHCFYFSYNDIEPQRKNHWKHGSHVHYVSNLWPRLDANRVWTAFSKRRAVIPGSFHIRFIPFDFSDSAPNSSRQSIAAAQFLFPPDISILNEELPTPLSQIATRGRWIANISLPPT